MNASCDPFFLLPGNAEDDDWEIRDDDWDEDEEDWDEDDDWDEDQPEQEGRVTGRPR